MGEVPCVYHREQKDFGGGRDRKRKRGFRDREKTYIGFFGMVERSGTMFFATAKDAIGRKSIEGFDNGRLVEGVYIAAC